MPLWRLQLCIYSHIQIFPTAHWYPTHFAFHLSFQRALFWLVVFSMTSSSLFFFFCSVKSTINPINCTIHLLYSFNLQEFELGLPFVCSASLLSMFGLPCSYLNIWNCYSPLIYCVLILLSVSFLGNFLTDFFPLYGSYFSASLYAW